MSIRIDGGVSFPEIETINDVGNDIMIGGDTGSLDLGLLANQGKLNSRPSPGLMEMRSDDIEIVDLDNSGPSINLNVRQPTPTISAPAVDEGIRILRDNGASSAFPKPAPIASTYGGSSGGGGGGAGAGAGGGVRSWFTGGAVGAETAEPTTSNGFSSWFASGGGASAAEKPEIYLTPEEEFQKKAEGLIMLERMDRKGITGNKLTIANTLEEINSEISRRKDSRALEASLRFQRQLLTTVTTGMEFLNNRYDPFGVRLDGWSESVNENIEDYDEIFEELYDKYKDKGKVAPEVRLIMSLGLSATMCHVTNTMFKSRMPGMDDILRNNPELKKQFANAAASSVGPGFGKFMSMAPGMGGGGGGPTPFSADDARGGSYDDGISGAGGPSMGTARREMRGPSGVDDILKSFDNAGEAIPPRSVPRPVGMGPSLNINMDDAVSVHSGMSGMTSATDRRRKRSNIVQPTGSTLTLNV
jgi:hypothetical protein